MLNLAKKTMKSIVAGLMACSTVLASPSMVFAESKEPLDLFTDYTQTELKSEWNSEEKLKKAYEEYAADGKYTADLQRAFAVLKGYVQKSDQSHTLSTKNGDIYRLGDMKDYSQNTLRFSSFGSNRQATGLRAPCGSTITVTAQGIPDDKPVYIQFGQILSYWQTGHVSGDNYYGGSYKDRIRNGINTITVPDFVAKAKSNGFLNEYVYPEASIYINCPYTEDEIGDFSLSFEGVKSYPIFYLEGSYPGKEQTDINEYLSQLHAYADQIRANKYSGVDITEFITKHLILTVTATRADEILSKEGTNLVRSLNSWDEMVEFMLKFDGVMIEDTPIEYCKQQYMVAQKWTGAGAYCDQTLIGIYSKTGGEDKMIDCYYNTTQKVEEDHPNIDWGFTHELGHALDVKGRVRGENTNNVYANAYSILYNNFYRASQPGEYYDQVAELGTSASQSKSLWERSDGLNFLVFSQLEAYRPGFWGEVDNFLRDSKKYVYPLTGMDMSERFAYIASSIYNRDLSDWFEKFGLNMSGNKPFKESSWSQEYKTLMEELKKKEGFINESLPFWLLDREQYKIMVNGLKENENFGNLFGADGSMKDVAPVISGISLEKNTYTLTLGNVDLNQALKVLVEASTDGKTYKEVAQLPATAKLSFSADSVTGTNPSFKVKVIDRQLNWSKESAPFIYQGNTPSAEKKAIAKIGSKEYYDLTDALNAVNFKSSDESNVITLLNDINVSGHLIQGDVTFKADKPVTITFGSSTDGSGFNIQSPGQNQYTIKFVGSEKGPITFTNAEGKTGSAIYATKTSNGQTTNSQYNTSQYPFNLVVENVTFENCKSGSNGAAIDIEGAVKATIKNCTFKNCSAGAGGAIWSSGQTTITGSTFENCSANEGGILYVGDKNSDKSEAFFDGKDGSINCDSINSLFAVGTQKGEDLAHLKISNVDLSTPEGVSESRTVLDVEAGSLTYGDNCRIDGKTKITRTGFIKIENGIWPQGQQIYNISQPTGDLKAFEGTDLETLNQHATIEGCPIDEPKSTENEIYVEAQNSNNIVYKTEGGTIKDSRYPTEYQPGSKIYLPGNVQKSGHTFVGWYSSEKFEGPSISTYQTPNEGGTITFYARWSNDVEHTHSWTKEEEYSVDSSCSYEGFKLYLEQCQGCKEQRYGKEAIVAKAHTFGPEVVVEEESKEPTCTEPGKKVTAKTCSVCGKEALTEETYQAKGHQYGAWVVETEADYNKTGSRYQECTVCGHKNYETIPAKTPTGGGGGGTGGGGSGGGSGGGGGSGSTGGSGSGAVSGGGETPGTDQNQDQTDQKPEEQPQTPTTEIIQNSDGSTTEKTKDPETGTTTTKTEKVDGSVETIVETSSGEKITETKAADGTTVSIKQDTTGFKEASIALSQSAAIKGQNEGSVSVEIPALPADKVDNEVEIAITTPAETTISIPVINEQPGSVAMIEDASGNLTPIPASLVKDGKLIIPLSGSAKIVIKDNAKIFKDVTTPVTDYPANGIAFLSARGIMTGVGTGENFDLYGSVTRGQLATILYRYNNSPDTSALPLPQGVQGADYYANASKWAVSTGLMGVGSDFNGGKNLTREQLALILYRVEGQPQANLSVLDSYQDKAMLSSEEMSKAVSWAVEKKIMGQGNPNLSPADSSKRADLATMISRYLQQK